VGCGRRLSIRTPFQKRREHIPVGFGKNILVFDDFEKEF
jgi:hypothetical protein